MMQSRRHLMQMLGGAALLPALGGLGACSPKADRLAVGFQRNGILYIARTRGELDGRLKAKVGLAPEWVEFPSGPPLIEAMSAGAIDFGAVGDTPVVYAQASGVDLRIVAGKVYGEGLANKFLVGAGSTISDAAGLKGRKVGYTRGSSAEVSALAALESVGLTVADIQPVFLAPGHGVSALGQGAVDALFTWDPFFTIAQQRAGARELRFDRAGLLATALFIARTALTGGGAPLLTAFLDELAAEARWANANKAEAVRLLAGAARMPEAEVEAMLGRLGGDPFGIEPPSAELEGNQQRVTDMLLKAESIKQPLKVSEIFWRGWTPAA